MNFVIVDVETTGGSPKSSKITELAMYKYDGNKIIDEFSSLINPEQDIPEFIVRLTGITNKHVKNAPKFYEIAKKVIDFFEDSIFVAHNVSFDYGMFRSEFKTLGYDFRKPHLCTVVASKDCDPTTDFFPLSVHYIEKGYAAGKIPGGFFKREGRPSEIEILNSRLIDRPIRPLFHEDPDDLAPRARLGHPRRRLPDWAQRPRLRRSRRWPARRHGSAAEGHRRLAAPEPEAPLSGRGVHDVLPAGGALPSWPQQLPLGRPVWRGQDVPAAGGEVGASDEESRRAPGAVPGRRGRRSPVERQDPHGDGQGRRA